MGISPALQQLLMLKGVITTLPQADQDKVNELADSFRATLRDEPMGIIALSLVGAEKAAED